MREREKKGRLKNVHMHAVFCHTESNTYTHKRHYTTGVKWLSSKREKLTVLPISVRPDERYEKIAPNIELH